MAPHLAEYSLANSDSSLVESGTEESPILKVTRSLLKPNGSIVGSQVAARITEFKTFASAIPTELTPRPALASIDGRKSITHRRVYDFCVDDYASMLHDLGVGRGHRVALVLPNGPELALAIVATAQWATAVPLSANMAASELEADLARCGADVVVGPYSGSLVEERILPDARFHVLDNNQDWTCFASIEESAEKLDIPFVGLVPSPYEAGIFRLVTEAPSPTSSSLSFHDSSLTIQRVCRDVVDQKANSASDECLVLFTSGTTGNKKLVPHQMGDMLTAATTIALSWNLEPHDINCNLMPLFHIGGIVRQIFSPFFSGGCVICCPSFDPSVFWSLLAKEAFTWYYAAPTMHQLILQLQDTDQCPSPKLKMIANAAGGLLPTLAIQLRDTFGANVLPSYGMTECMPISSPPSTYELTKPGTSGVAVGPEIAILNVSTMQSLPFGTEGPICVRGEPCFRGYGKLANDPDAPLSETFLEDGWFQTGDLGHMDEDGYLYITGRSKEVINRGGEIIPPMEVEEAVSMHPDIVTCAAFSASHDVLQEVVGIVLVMKQGRPRLDLVSLHRFLSERLAAPKWPQCLVFLDGLPKSRTNKLLRVKLGSRFGLPELNDDMPYLQRTYEGECPPQGTGLGVPIRVKQVSVSADDTNDRLVTALVKKGDYFSQGSRSLKVIVNPKRADSLACYVHNIDTLEAIEVSREVLDGYAVPTHFVEMNEPIGCGTVFPEPETTDALVTILQRAKSSGPVDPLVESVQDIFFDLLQLDCVPQPDENFFHLGGSSLLASQLASKIRKQFAIACSGAEIFQQSTCDDLAKVIAKRSGSDTTATTSVSSGSQEEVSSVSGHGAPLSSERLPIESSWIGTIFQLIPMFVILPLWQVTRYLLFFAVVLRSFDVVPGNRDLFAFVIAYFAFHLCWVTITPLVFVAIKWAVIGRYQPGRYRIYGSYYLRWWFVDVCRKLFHRGIWGSNEVILNFYYRLLGAKIGKGARISLEADVAEFDLVSIGENAAVEMSTLRGFGVDNGAMILGPVSVGNDASVGVRSVVSPFTGIADGNDLGPVTSSYDMQGLNAKNARVNRRRLPEPSLWMQFLVGTPISFLVNCIGQIPPLVMLWGLLQYKGEIHERFVTPSDLMQWLCDYRRLPFFIGIRIARAVLSPLFYMAAAIFVKKFVIGRFLAGPRNVTSQWQLMRHQLSATLFSRKKIQSVVDIIGRHYELVSCLYRLLGARVGKRVFWPGHQLIFSGEFELLEIGDDVVFGSRSTLLCTTRDSCEKIILCAGANVADNSVVLPGSIIGKNAVLGSNSICPEGYYLPEGSVWLGSKGCVPICLERGSEDDADRPVDASQLPMVGDASTLRPFGKAFYEHKATYFVWPLSWVISMSVFLKGFIEIFHSMPLYASLQGAASILYAVSIHDRDYHHIQYPFFTIYLAILYTFFWANIVRVILWLLIELSAKWGIMGRREVGRYNYDTSSYGQRWELYQLIAKIRKFNRLNLLEFIFGTPLASGFFRLSGGDIGKDCCLYPSGADPFMPEPDLVSMGDGCVIDCASIVCHLNTRGNFELAKIVMERDCTLRTRSRVQQGVYMEYGSMLLEKSLAMTGEIVEAESVWQGSPASWWFQSSKKSAPLVKAGTDDTDESSFTESSLLLSSTESLTSHYGV